MRLFLWFSNTVLLKNFSSYFPTSRSIFCSSSSCKNTWNFFNLQKVYGCILICLGFLVYFGFTKDPFIMMLFWVSHSIIPSSNGSTCRRSARASWMQTFFLFRDDVVAEVSCLSLLMLRKFVTLLYDIFSIEKTSSQMYCNSKFYKVMKSHRT